MSSQDLSPGSSESPGTSYRVDSSSSVVVVKARSSIHDTETRWTAMSGTIQVDANAINAPGAGATVAVDMREFDAGDWLKNRKIKKDLDVGKHPHAEFVLSELSEVTEQDAGRFAAVARGVLRWRGREAAIEARGQGIVGPQRIEATATFDLDVTTLGVKPPKVLMFKVEDVVTVTVTVVATV